MRLANGSLWPMPITLDITQAQVDQLALKSGSRVTLRDPRDDNALAILTGEWRSQALWFHSQQAHLEFSSQSLPPLSLRPTRCSEVNGIPESLRNRGSSSSSSHLPPKEHSRRLRRRISSSHLQTTILRLCSFTFHSSRTSSALLKGRLEEGCRFPDS